MENPRTTALKYIVAQFLQAAKDEKEFEGELKKVREALSRARARKETYSLTLQAEGIEPDSIPPHLIDDDEVLPLDTLPADVQETEDRPGEHDTASEPSQTPLIAAESNGHAQGANEVQPLSDTHAVFLVFRRAGNPWLSSEQVYQKNVEYGYNLTKYDILRIIGRQMPRRMFLKEGDMYKLSDKGMAFNNFRRAGERHEGAGTAST